MSTKLKAMALCLMISVCTLGQSEIKYEGETINRIDKDGKKQGVWKLFDTKRAIMVVGNMENDVFISNIEYYQNGKLVVSQNKDKGEYVFYVDSKAVRAKTIVEKDEYKIVAENGETLEEVILANFKSIGSLAPFFYGAPNAMQNFLNNEMNKKKWNDSGKVKFNFIVDKNGWITEVKVAESGNETLNEDAIRIVEKMPRWQPGFDKGKFVLYRLNSAITFDSGM